MQKKTLGNILTNLKIDALNEMQEASLKANKEHKDVILLSATGSGKTLAFLLPVLERLDPANKKTQALIVVPSRELALQIEKVFRQMGTGYKVTACYGGHLRETEENNLIEAPAVIVGTPGRLGDHIRRENIKTDGIETLVLDEFDKTLELGFQEEVSFVVESLPHIKKHILTSATEAVEIPSFLELQEPAKLDFLPEDGITAPRLEIKQVLSPENDKVETLFRLICHLGNRSTIVFCNHRESVERTGKMLSEKGILNTFYHGAMEQRDRDVALTKFRNGTVNVLVTTDLAARGLDIPHIRYIIHFQLPHTEDSWTHRNGRTARMEASGTAIVMLAPDEKLMPYLSEEQVDTITLPEKAVLPEKPKWVTLFIGAGKKDKVNKIDIVGFLSKKGELKKDDIGLIEVKDFFSFAAVVRSKMSYTLELIKNEKIKNKKVKIDIAR
ncbi:ATP-independent RNA helicase DbpA [Chitinophaga terrae (ex Kim and Jung 2007)]|uniref:ATP-independent RNA helicase DbpA n=1 Tax=Chitinophaga terrae (ex Kim and Jung 2007) TaxID=408074 RepID=A0A1H3YV93_9BACT|nr:DEAD/DEAH box helicase [Chitinophaga terrae (ex Kim and Jung 2007)]GEP88518.1 helicase [Chitinophaga terrae (ex Kim and Jung 2007)]SEA15317.1 ATP-independent RNA helicase DbpA [Chitinophaga terrae (ex Kim and Jung 2007)]